MLFIILLFFFSPHILINPTINYPIHSMFKKPTHTHSILYNNNKKKKKNTTRIQRLHNNNYVVP
jgi:hypothetical protein